MEDQELKIQVWGEFLAKSAQVRFLKKRAVVSENFAEASKLKKDESDLQRQLTDAQNSVLGGATGGGASAKDVAKEKTELEALKRKAVEAEDFAEAGRLKKRLKLLEEGEAAAGNSKGCSTNQQEVTKRAWQAALHWIQAAIVNPAEAKAVKDELAKSAPSGTLDGMAGASAPNQAGSSTGVKRKAADAKPAAAAAAAATSATVPGPTSAASPVPEISHTAFLKMSKEELWQKAWEVAWKRADAQGEAGNEAQVKARAQKLWKGWLQEQSQALKQKAAAGGDVGAKAGVSGSASPPAKAAAKVASKAHPKPKAAPAVAQASAGPTAVAAKTGPAVPGQEWRTAQERNWRGTAEADWQRAKVESEKRASGGGDSSSSRDLCAIIKARCPADQPLPFERLLAVCPSKTMVKQLIQAMAKEPQEFRQNIEGSEFCVRPVNSRCADWLPVNSRTIPRGFKENGCLPESMLNKARLIFEEKMKPLGQAAEDPLVIFLTQPGRLPADSPIPFTELISRCPPGTTVAELVRTMAKKRDLFRQDATGKMFCVRPRVRCKDWGAVNPYADPTAVKTSSGGGSMMGTAGGGVVGGPMVSGEDGGGED